MLRLRRWDQISRRKNALDRPAKIPFVRPGVARQPYDPWSHRAAASDANGRPEPDVIDFGRYAGWRIADVARHDPDYLRWLSRH